MNSHTKKNVSKWALVFGLVIVLNLFFNYALSLVYVRPVWEDLFGRDYFPSEYYDESSCTDVGGKWYPPVKGAPEKIPVGSTTPESVGWCDPNYTKQIQYDEANKLYERNTFIVLVVLGAVSIALGVLIPLEVLALGFSWGGVLSLLVASLRFWSEADTILKVVILLVALLGLIFVAVKKFKNE